MQTLWPIHHEPAQQKNLKLIHIIALMRYKSRAIDFEHKNVVDNPYLTTLHKLHLALVAQGVNRETDADARIYMPRLCEELDVKRHTLHVTRRLGWVKARNTLSRARVVPLPLLHIAAKLGIGLCYAHF